LILFRKDIAFASVHAYDAFKTRFDQFNPIKSNTEQMLALGASVAFFIARTKDLRKHSIVHKENRGLLTALIVGVICGFLIDIDE